MPKNRFPLSSSDCELLLELEESQTIEKTAQAFGKDPSGVSRQLARICEKYPAIEKTNGRWLLTKIGKKLNAQTRDAIQAQTQLAELQSILRIGTNREFAARVMAPQMGVLSELFPNTRFMLHTFASGTEEALLSGQIDIGIDCDRPTDPEIAYKQIIPEPIVAVAAKYFLKKYKSTIENQGLYQTPHLACERLYPDKIFSENENKLNIIAYFNDISTTRAACLTGAGWALLPRYAVKNEVDAKQLYILREKPGGQSRYGVWWSRSRFTNKDTITKMCDWLKTQSL
jgi:DNA-binding transcriptional LysR family regulator